MPNLVEGPSPRKIEFAVSLPHSLLAAAALVCAAPQFEGLADWLREARARMPAELLSELCLLVTFPGHYQRFTAELSAYLPATAHAFDFDDLLAHLQAVPDVHYQLIALRALARGASPPPAPTDLIDLLDRPDEWAAYLRDVNSEAAPDVVAALIHDAQALKARLLDTLEQFWQQVYAAEFGATRPMMERSVAHHRALAHSPIFHDLFTTVTGRLVPERIADLLPEIATVTFVPSCYVGPYVAYTHYADRLYLFYNCRSTPSDAAATDSASLYPPLKALADETRLQILTLLQDGEMYAQEIVDRLDISQPAVSRHLNLMATAGVLTIRREGNAKYYSVNAGTLTRVADALRALV